MAGARSHGRGHAAVQRERGADGDAQGRGLYSLRWSGGGQLLRHAAVTAPNRIVEMGRAKGHGHAQDMGGMYKQDISAWRQMRGCRWPEQSEAYAGIEGK